MNEKIQRFVKPTTDSKNHYIPGTQSFSNNQDQNFLKSPDFGGINSIGPTNISVPPSNSNGSDYCPPYIYPTLSEKEIRDLYCYYQKKTLETELKKEEINHEYSKRTELENVKTKLKISQAEAYNQIRINKEQEIEEIGLNPNNYVVLRKILPDGSVYESPALVDVLNLSIEILFASGSATEVELLRWDGCTQPFHLTCGNNEILFSKQLRRQGITLRANKNNRRNIADLLYTYLIKHATRREIPLCFGWNKMSDGSWHFADEKEVTLNDFG